MSVVETRRVNLGKGLPAAYAAVVKLDAAAEQAAVDAGFDRGFVDLLRVRVSQLNGCAFCLRLHSGDALKAGEHPDRLATVPAWSETEMFTPGERAALGLVEAITGIDDADTLADAHVAAAEVLTEEQVAAVSWVALAINTFNRIAVSSGYVVAS